MDCFASLAMTLKQPVASLTQHGSNGVRTGTSTAIIPATEITNNKRHRSDDTMEKGIFDGLKVLDCASFIAPPAAATVLSDFGADVIKIEPPFTANPYPTLPTLPPY